MEGQATSISNPSPQFYVVELCQARLKSLGLPSPSYRVKFDHKHGRPRIMGSNHPHPSLLTGKRFPEEVSLEDQRLSSLGNTCFTSRVYSERNRPLFPPPDPEQWCRDLFPGGEQAIRQRTSKFSPKELTLFGSECENI